MSLLEPLKAARALRFTVILTQRIQDAVRMKLGPLPYELVQRERPGIGFRIDADDF